MTTAEQLATLSDEDLLILDWESRWRSMARANQLAPEGDWSTWLVMAGRGFGKSLCGLNWAGLEAAHDPGSYTHILAPTLNDVRLTCFEGPVGLINLIPEKLIDDYNRTLFIIRLVNGAIIRGFSAQEPERLRGPQCHRLLFDEMAATDRTSLGDSWDMAMFGLRLGPHPRAVVTTTPKPLELLHKLVKEKTTVVTRGSTYDNRDNLSDRFYQQVAQYEGTTIGRQEIHGELIDPEEAGIIKRSWIRMWKNRDPLPTFHFIVMSLDTAFTERTIDQKTHEPDPTACTVWGLFNTEEKKIKHGIEEKKGKPGIMLLDAWQDHLGFPELVKRARSEMISRYGGNSAPLIKPLVGLPRLSSSGRRPDVIIIEDKGSGISLRQVLEREGIPCYKYNPHRADKLQRLHAVSHMFANGFIWMIESDKTPGQLRSWTQEPLQQLCTFTGSGSIRHDDFVDSVTQAIRVITDKMIGGVLDPVHLSNQPSFPEDAVVVPFRRPSNPYAM